MLYRRYGRAVRGKKVYSSISGKRFARTSMIAGLLGKTLVAPFVFKGYCDTSVVLTWVEKVLLPEIPRGSTIIWDNASFHKSSEILALIEAGGCRLLFLPAYSPDLNPIENWWAILKRFVTDGIREGLTLLEAITSYWSNSS